MDFREKYGEWAFVAGGSVGMGGAFCDYLAKEGMNIIVTGRHLDTVSAKCRQLEADFGVKTRELVLDLGDLNVLDKVHEGTDDLEVGFLVYNAGLVNMALFPEKDIEVELYRHTVNNRSLLALAMLFCKGMYERKKGGMIFVSSGGGVVGTPFIQTYSATKAYNFTLAEALWGELSEFGIDVMAVLPGKTIGQNYTDVPAGTPGFQTGAEVVAEAFEHLGQDPTWITGQSNRDNLSDMFPIEKRKQYIRARGQEMSDIRNKYGSGSPT